MSQANNKQPAPCKKCKGQGAHAQGYHCMLVTCRACNGTGKKHVKKTYTVYFVMRALPGGGYSLLAKGTANSADSALEAVSRKHQIPVSDLVVTEKQQARQVPA